MEQYIVIEIQKDNGIVSTIPTAHATRNDAEAHYHQVLMYAAQSTIELHAAVMLHEDGYFIKNEVFRNDGDE